MSSENGVPPEIQALRERQVDIERRVAYIEKRLGILRNDLNQITEELNDAPVDP